MCRIAPQQDSRDKSPGSHQLLLDRRKIISYNNIYCAELLLCQYPGVAQLVARLVRDQEAVGSNPVTRTMASVLTAFEML